MPALPQGYNLLLVTVDQERHFGTYPFPVPGRERLMARGVTFTHHTACSIACTSSRSVMYTGWHMPQTAMYDNTGLPWMTHSLDPALGTLGTLLGESGYYAAYLGKWHLSNELDRVYVAGDIAGQPSAKFHAIMKSFGFEDYHGLGDVIGGLHGGYLYDDTTTGQAIGWLRGTGKTLNAGGAPWFLAVNLVNPHDVMFVDTDEPGEREQWTGSAVGMHPAQPPDHPLYRAAWDDVPLPASRHQPWDAPGRPPAHREYQQARAVLVGEFPDEDRRWRKLQSYYFNCIRDSDTHLVRMLEELDRLDLARKTIVVFTSDHGELGGHHRMHGKGSSVYREQLRVPMVVAHPAFPGGASCQALTCHLDLAPTLLGLTGLPAARRRALLGDRKGRDFSPLLAAPERAGPHAVRDASLYAYAMILYTDARYLSQMRAIRHRQDLDAQGKRRAVEKLRVDLDKRSGIRCIDDGRHKFARYFSLRQHHLPRSLAELLAGNDVELFDLRDDPHEMHNLAADPRRHDDLLMAMNRKLNALIEEEIGSDEGDYLPMSGFGGWNLQVAVE
jgi:arylsulfatase A-like enzyme